MSTEIEQRVVQMRFDNQQFESGTKVTMSTLDKLKEKLKFHNITDGFSKITSSAKNVDLSSISNGAETVSVKFSALQTIAMTALSNITNSAINAGKHLVSAFTIDPIKTGFQEYETQINAIQTILANTKSKGSTLEDVNKALDELNTYADKTIYNFTEMTKNIGTFTAAGVDLATSTGAIKGIANLGAISGSTSQQVSTAMYQLSQALASGKVSLQDWNSVVNAGMGGEIFQEELKATARHFGIDVDGMIAKYGTFRESLTEGAWLTTDVLTATLQKFTGDLNKEQLMAQGYTEQEAQRIVELGQMANAAATEVKTFSQLIDTTKEAVQSGWTQTWEYIIGDFEEAKTLFTGISNALGDIIQKSADRRNNMLAEWKGLGGRTELIKGLSNTFKNLGSILKSIGDAWNKVFPPTSGARLFEITKKFSEFTEKLKLSDKALANIKKTFEGVFTVLKVVVTALTQPLKIIPSIVLLFKSLGTAVFEIGAIFGDFITSFKGFFSDFNLVDSVINLCKKSIEGLANLISKIDLSKARDNVVKSVKAMKDAIKGLFSFSSKSQNGDKTVTIGSKIIDIFTSLKDSVAKLGNALSKSISNMDFLDVLNTFFSGMLVKNISKFFKSISECIDSVGESFGVFKGLGKSITDTLDALGETLKTWQSNLKASALIKIAIAIGIIAAALVGLSKVETSNLKNAIYGIGTILSVLALATKFSTGIESRGLLVFSISLATLANSMKTLSDIDSKGLERGALGIAALMTMVTILSKTFEGGSFKGSSNIISLAFAINLLVVAVKNMGDMNWNSLAKGLTGVAGLLLEISVYTKLVDNKSLIMSSTSIMILGTALILLANSVEKLGTMKWSEIAKGLTGVGGLLLGLAGYTRLVDNKSLIMSSTGMIILGYALNNLLTPLTTLSKMKWMEIVKGLTGVGVLLLELGAYTRLVKTTDILKLSVAMIAMSSAMILMTQAITPLTNLSWEGMAKGLLTVAGLLAEMAAFTYIVNDKNLISLGVGLIGVSAALLIMSNAVIPLAGLSWEGIAKGLTAIVGILASLAGFVYVINPASLMTAGAGLIIVSGALIIISNVLGTLAGLSWDGIAKGIVAIAGSLAVLAAGMLYMSLVQAGVSGMLLASAALLVLGNTVKMLSTLSWGALAVSLAAIAGTLILFATAAYALAPVSGVLLSLSVSMIAFSVAMAGFAAALALAGVALINIATAFKTFSKISGPTMDQFCNGLTKLVKTILDLLPLTARILGEAIIEIIKVLEESGTILLKAAVTLGKVLLDALLELVPDIVEVGMKIIDDVLRAIADNIDSVIYNLARIIINAIKALTKFIPEMVVAAVDLIKALLTSIFDAVAALDWNTIVQMTIGASIFAVFCGICAALLPLIPSAMAGLAGFGLLVAEAVAIIAALGGIAQIPGFKWLVGEGGVALQLIGRALGGFFGSLVGSAMEQVSASLPSVGANLSSFMNNAKAFFEGCKGLDSGLTDSVKRLVESVTLLTAGALIDKINEFIMGESALTRFGKQLAEFAPYYKQYADTMSGVNADVVEKTATAAKTLTEMAKMAPNKGGLVSLFTGDNSLTQFAEELVTFGKAFKKYSDTVTGVNPEVVTASANAAKTLCEFAKIVPNKGGLVSLFTGDNTLSDFAEDLTKFGPSLKKYSDSVVGINVEAIKQSVDATKAIVKMADAIPNEGGVAAFFAGDNTLSKLATHLETFGPAIKKYSDTVTGISLADINTSVVASKTIMSMMNEVPDKMNLKDFGNELENFGNRFSNFYTFVASVQPDVVISVVSSIRNVIDLIKDMSGVDSNVLANFSEGLRNIATDAIDNFVKAFSNADTEVSNAINSFISKAISNISSQNSKFYEAGQALMTNLVNGIIFKTGGVTNAIKSIIMNGASVISSSVGQYRTAGAGLISSLIEGINSKKGNFINVITTMIKNALNATNNASREFTKIGNNIITNISNGIKSRENVISSQLKNILNAMKNSITNNSAAFGNAGISLMNAFANGLSRGGSNAYSICNRAAANAKSGLTGYYSSFYSAGAYLMQGFANGISSNSYRAAAAASAAANAANRAARNALGIHSPSKVGEEIGKYFDMGIANGIFDNDVIIADKANKVVTTMKDAIRYAMTNLPSMLEEDFNLSPVITPVIDTSNMQNSPLLFDTDVITNRARRMSSMFNENRQNEFVSEYNNKTLTEEKLNSMIELLNDIKNKDSNVYMDSKKVGKAMANPIDNELSFNSRKRW